MTPDAHALIYELLALSFSYPDASFAERLKGLVGELEVEVLAEDSHGLPVLPIVSFIRALATFDQQMVGQAQQEYVRLLAESHPEALCSAHEWFYRLEVPRNTLACALQETYAFWGQDVSLDVATRVETELGLLALLCRRLDDDEAAQRARQDFLDEHALRWLPRFAVDVAACTRLDFYRAAARLLGAFLEIETATQINSGDTHPEFS